MSTRMNAFRVSREMLVTAIALLACVLSLRTASGETFRHTASGIECPDEVAGFRRTEVQDFESRQPGLGVACKYQLKSDLFADVYIFKGGVANIPADISHPLIVQLREQTLNEIAQAAQMRGELARRGTSARLNVQTEQGPVAVYYDALIVSSPRASRNTFVWLWTARNHVLKIRMTLPSSGDLDLKIWREFYETVVRLSTPSRDAKRRVDISLAKTSSPIEMTIRMAYGLGLSDWINKNQLTNSAPEGPFVPSFEAELHARQSQLQVWRELSEKGTPSFPYMEEMLRVASAGYLREYIWRHHPQSNWGVPPADLRMDVFMQWSTENLRDHLPQKGAQVVFGPTVSK